MNPQNIVSPKYGIHAVFFPTEYGLHTQVVSFEYEGEKVELSFDAFVSEQTKQYMPDFAKAEVDMYVEKKIKDAEVQEILSKIGIDKE